MERITSGRNDPEWKAEKTNAFLVETVERLSRRCPAHLVGMTALEALMDLGPHLQDALVALTDIERDRDLTDKERGLQHAFKILLTVRTYWVGPG
jgi:hypothetical protein